MKCILMALLGSFVFTACLHAGTIGITGTVRGPDGNAFNGTMRFTLSVSTALDTCSSNIVVAQRVNFAIRNGMPPTSAKITPNDCLSPANTTYMAEYFTATGLKVGQQNFYISGTQFDLTTAAPTPLTTSNISFDLTPFIPQPTARDCSKESGSDEGVKLAACISNLPSTGGTADMRGFTGSPTAATAVTISKANVSVILPPNGITCAGGCFNITASGVSLLGHSVRQTYLTSSSATADVIAVSAAGVLLRDFAFRCTSAIRTAGAALHWGTGTNGRTDNLWFEPCFNDLQMDTATSGDFGPMTMAPTSNTPAAAVCNTHILLSGASDTSSVVTDTTFMHPIISTDRTCGGGGSVVVDQSTDTITFFNPEVIATNPCRAAACGAAFRTRNTSYPTSQSPRTIRVFGGIFEGGASDIIVDIGTCKDCLFEGSSFDNGLIAVRINETATGQNNGNVRFINGRIIQAARQCVIITGGNGVFIQGNRIGGCANLAGGFPAIDVASDVLKFHIDNNFFEPSFTYSFLPTYFVNIGAGGGDQFTVTYNQWLDSNRATGNLNDGSTGLNKIIGPNNQSSSTSETITGPYISKLATGAPPIVVSSTTPATNLNAWPVTYNGTTGTQLTGSFMQWGTGTASGAGTATVFLATAFTLAGTYVCMIQNNDAAATAATVTSYSSGAQFSVNVGRASPDNFRFMCLGN